MITENQAHRLAEAGLYALNHIYTQKSIIKWFQHAIWRPFANHRKCS
jgi:hypothetical protein